MCGSQNASEPKGIGPGIGGRSAREPRAREHHVASQAAGTANTVSKEQIAYQRRLGLNRLQVMEVLKSLAGSIDPRAPMRKFATFKEEHGRIPRSDDNKTVLLSELPLDNMVFFVSHRWLRPYHTREECEKHRHVWAGMAHPDDTQASKHKVAGGRRRVPVEGPPRERASCCKPGGRDCQHGVKGANRPSARSGNREM